MKPVILIGLVAMTVALLLLAGADKVLQKTNTMEFCISCHSMQIPYAEYKESIHFKNASGVRAACPDCHVPQALWPKLWAKIQAVKDVYHELTGEIDTLEKFEQHRWEMAQRVWETMRASPTKIARAETRKTKLVGRFIPAM